MFSKAIRGLLGILAAVGILSYLTGRREQAAPENEPEQAGASHETPPAGQELTGEQAAEIVSTWTTLNPP